VHKLLVCLAVAGACAAAPGSSASAQVPGAAPLTYQAALELAASRNLGLEAARRQKAIREARVRTARQFPNPDVAFESTEDVPHHSLMFSLPVEIGGQRGRRIDLARVEAAQADLDVRAELRTLQRNLRETFFGLLAADERVRLAKDLADLAGRAREVARARFEEGAAPRLDVLSAELDLARASADLDLARSQRAAAQAGLNAVLDQPAGQAISVTGDLSAAGTLPDPAAAASLAASNNPDLLSAQQDASVEERRLGLVRAERLPTPTFSLGGVFDAPGELRAGWTGGVSLTVPLFNRSGGELAEARATLLQLQAKRDAIRRSVENTVFAALARIDGQRRQMEAYRATIVPAAAELAALAEESYRLGRSPVLAFIEAQRVLRDTRREYLQALVDFQTAVADLEEVIGAPIQ